MPVLAQGRALCTVGTQIDGRVKHRFLTHPDAVFHHGIDRTTDRAVSANCAANVNFSRADCHSTLCGLSLLHQRKLGRSNAHPQPQTGASQKRTPVHGGQSLRQPALQAVNKG